MLAMKRILIGLAAIVALVVILVATGPRRTNPPVVAEPTWDSLGTRALAQRACFDCHSNETNWPTSSKLPLAGNLIESHVVNGRAKLNFSEWGVPGREQESGREAAEKVYEPMHYAEDDLLPQPPYTWIHPTARLTDAERDQLAQGLRLTLGDDD